METAAWPNADAGGKRRQKLVNSGPSGSEELGCFDYIELDSFWNVMPLKLSVHQS